MEVDQIAIDTKRNFRPCYVLDIGAHTGSWSISHKEDWWPHAKFKMIEANPECELSLRIAAAQIDGEYVMAALYSRCVDGKAFYSHPEGMCTGASLFKDMAPRYVNVGPTYVDTTTLDDVLEVHEHYDYIKLDTQGSELDIVIGGETTFKEATYVEMEVTPVGFRKNMYAPWKEEVVHEMLQRNYSLVGVLEDDSFQQNVLFRNEAE